MLRLKRDHDRPRVHPWIFKADVADVSDVAPGSALTIVDASARFVGRGFYNPRPALCCRILTRRDEPLDLAFFRGRLERALHRSGRWVATTSSPSTAGRLVWSEADLLPGLVVDRYRDLLVLQCQTLGMAQVRPLLVAALRAHLGDRPVLSADEDTPAALEGFAPERGWFDRPGPDEVVVDEGPVRLRVSLGAGHKTGLYLDQAENRRRAAALANDHDMLDAFSYTAGFACHALRGGARRVLCLESSPEAVRGAHANLALNGLAGAAEVRGVNAFDELRRLGQGRARFGLIVLDPPPFAPSRAALPGAARGYKDINLRAMRLLAPGGHLMTFACSHHVTPGRFEEICREAAADLGITLWVVEALGQAADHPVLLTAPETRYLNGLLLRAG
ncbi:MAG: class I SAM-dependent rRNA methyltransferase [Candidatus Rokuibacteriota bacterium]